MKYDDHGKAIAKGILAAWATYYRWSGNEYVHGEGIEAFFSGKVAESLFKSFPDTCRVRLEPAVRELCEDSGAEGTRGRVPTALRSGGRVDIAFYNNDYEPTGVVEIKRMTSASGHSADVRRIVTMLDRLGPSKGGSLRWGAVAGMHTLWRKTQTGEAKAHKVADSIRAIAPSRTVTPIVRTRKLKSPIVSEDNVFRGCSGICILIT